MKINALIAAIIFAVPLHAQQKKEMEDSSKSVLFNSKRLMVSIPKHDATPYRFFM